MRVLLAALWILALAAAFALGRLDAAAIGSDPAPMASFREALDQRNPLVRSYGISRFLRQLSAENVDEVVEVVEAAGPWFDEQDHLLLMTAWTGFDDRGAVDWAFSRPGRFKPRAAAAVIEALAFRNPPSALYFIESLNDPELADLLYGHMVVGWARSDFKDDLTNHLMGAPPGISRQRATGTLTLEILKEDADALIEWFDEIPDDANENYKRTAFHKTADALAGVDPARAAEWIGGHPDRDYAARARKVIARRWAERDSAAALDWLVTLPASEERSENIVSTFKSWLKRDAKQAEAWVRSASPAEGVDPAVRALVRRDSRARPDSALDWAHRIHDPAVRLRVLTMVGRSWFARDPKAFQSWLPESGLANQLRDLILKARPRPERVDGGSLESTFEGGSPEGS